MRAVSDRIKMRRKRRRSSREKAVEEEEVNPSAASQHLCNLSASVPLQEQHLLKRWHRSSISPGCWFCACSSCRISLSFQLSEFSLSGAIVSRGRDIKKQHEQRVYERKMQRINLPLSAFSNPSCELLDENTIVITAEHETTPVQEAMDGGDPLIGQQTGTPGAWVQSVWKKNKTMS